LPILWMKCEITVLSSAFARASFAIGAMKPRMQSPDDRPSFWKRCATQTGKPWSSMIRCCSAAILGEEPLVPKHPFPLQSAALDADQLRRIGRDQLHGEVRRQFINDARQ